jgi:hypothetical protein
MISKSSNFDESQNGMLRSMDSRQAEHLGMSMKAFPVPKSMKSFKVKNVLNRYKQEKISERNLLTTEPSKAEVLTLSVRELTKNTSNAFSCANSLKRPMTAYRLGKGKSQTKREKAYSTSDFGASEN